MQIGERFASPYVKSPEPAVSSEVADSAKCEAAYVANVIQRTYRQLGVQHFSFSEALKASSAKVSFSANVSSQDLCDSEVDVCVDRLHSLTCNPIENSVDTTCESNVPACDISVLSLTELLTYAVMLLAVVRRDKDQPFGRGKKTKARVKGFIEDISSDEAFEPIFTWHFCEIEDPRNISLVSNFVTRAFQHNLQGSLSYAQLNLGMGIV